MSLKTKVYIWLLDRGLVKVKPWEDPRRSPEDRALWIKSEPKSLKGKVA